MNFERIPENYSATSIIYKEHGDLIYFVRPNKNDGEDRTKARLLWDKKNSFWYALIEGSYSDNLGKGFFAKGPFMIDSDATKNLCKHFGIPVEFGNREGTIGLISMTSPEQFIQIKESNKLEKASKK